VTATTATRLFLLGGGALGRHDAVGRCGRVVGYRGTRGRDPNARRCQSWRLPTLRESMDAGANASVLPAFSVASLVGFGAVIAMLPAFSIVRDWVLTIGGGPLVSLAMATNVLAAPTGSASGGMTIALDALGDTHMRIAAEQGIDPALMHRVAAIGSGTLDSLPHNGAVVTLLAVCGSTHRESYLDIGMVGIVRALIALAAVILLGSAFGSF
jgi:H+/gluconate symporter-like permease